MAIISLQQTAVNLGVAPILGAIIGFERQWRQRLAGLRTGTAEGRPHSALEQIVGRLRLEPTVTDRAALICAAR